MIFFILILVILTFMALWNFDLHKLLHVKSVSQNGGDAASLMAARWQGISLNVVGDLNLMHAIALTTGDTNSAAAISGIQDRLLFVGPMIALQASQQAAKNNGIFPNQAFTDFIREHANTVRYEYTAITGPTGEMLFPEPYPDAWLDYATMLDLIAADGVAAGPDNMQLYTDASAGGHVLYDTGFYDAIAGRSWCWFHNSQPTLLQSYANFFPAWWPPLPPPPERTYSNSEFFGLHLEKVYSSLSAEGPDASTLSDIAIDRGFTRTAISSAATQIDATWFVYGGRWGSWDAMSAYGGYPFPISGSVKEQYDYSGADAAVRVEATTQRLTPGSGGSTISNTLTWTSAAKPFGFLNESDRPMDYDLVLPAFHDVRLIPVDASSAPAGGGFNLAWRKHLGEHLPNYMASGPFSLPSGCYYCQQLRTWESVAFRQSGVNWLALHSDRCDTRGGDPGGGGGGGGDAPGGGGPRRGH